MTSSRPRRPSTTRPTAALAFAALAGLAAAVFAGQAIARQSRREWADLATLSALGLSRNQALLTAAWRGSLTAVGAVTVAAVVAIALSPLGPLGVARETELEHDPACRLAPVDHRLRCRARRRPARHLHPRCSDEPEDEDHGHDSDGSEPRRAAPPLASACHRRRDDGGQRRAWRQRASLRRGDRNRGPRRRRVHRRDRPRQQPLSAHRDAGTLRRAVGLLVRPAVRRTDRRRARRDLPRPVRRCRRRRRDRRHRRRDRRSGLLGPVVPAGPGVADVVDPPITAGRAPVRPDEIALGAITMRQLGVGIGDTVHVASTVTSSDPSPMTVVGTTLINDTYEGSPGLGAVVTPEWLAQPPPRHRRRIRTSPGSRRRPTGPPSGPRSRASSDRRSTARWNRRRSAT